MKRQLRAIQNNFKATKKFNQSVQSNSRSHSWSKSRRSNDAWNPV